MNMQIDWHEELDSSFGAGPDLPPTDYVAPGRAALRRRRTAMGATVLATVLAIGGIGWAVAGGDGADGHRSSDVATDPVVPDTSSPAGPDPIPLLPIASRPEDVRIAKPAEAELEFGPGSLTPVAVLGTGELVRKDGWSIEAIYVLDAAPRARSWGVSARPTAGGTATWMLIDWDRRGSSITSDPEGKRFALFEDWMDTTWAEQRDVVPPPVSRTVDGRLELTPGVQALETVEHPAEAAAYGPVGDYVAAKLRLQTGTILFALVGPDGGTTVDPAVLDSPTMAAFLAHVADQGDNGEGLR